MIRIGDKEVFKVNLYGACEQNGTPSPDAPIDIVCNNGVLKVNSQGQIYADGTQETVTDSKGNTANAEMLLSVGDYKDTQEVLSGNVTKNVGIKVLDGTEDWQQVTIGGGYNAYNISKSSLGTDSVVLPSRSDKFISTHYQVSTAESSALQNNVIWIGTNNVNFVIDATVTTLVQFKQWLADQYTNGTPVIIVYPLAEPTTETVTPQLLSGTVVTQTAGSIPDMDIDLIKRPAELINRFITDSNGVPHKVISTFVGNKMIYNTEPVIYNDTNAEFYKRQTANGAIEDTDKLKSAIKEVRGKSIVWNQLLKEGILVDMGLPSGTLWASRNIDITQEDGFAASPFQYECSFFSWGNVDCHNPIGTTAFDYRWNSDNYNNTQGSTLTGNIAVGEKFDAARANLGAPWRMPTSAEFTELFDNIRYINAEGTEVDTTNIDKRVVVNGVLGLYLESTINGERLFFPSSGYGSGSDWKGYGNYGYYWTSSYISNAHAGTMYFDINVTHPNKSDARYYGFTLRPVLTHKLTPETDGKGHKFIQYGDNITDLTLMYGTGNEPSSVEDFVKLYPLNRYTYNAGEVIPFAGQNLVTTGFNQWDEQWELGALVYDGSVSEATNRITTSFIRVLPNTQYYITRNTFYGRHAFYDANRNLLYFDINGLTQNIFTTPENAAYLRITLLTNYGTTYNNDICINFSDPDRNGTYEPYEKHTLPLDPSQWRDKDGNLVFPYGGMHGVGTAYDYAKVDADGYIRKAVRCFGQVDLGTLNWALDGYFYALHTFIKSGNNINFSCAKYAQLSWDAFASNLSGSRVPCIAKYSSIGAALARINVFDPSYATAASFKAAMNGVPLIYELAEPVEVELATPIYAKYLVDKDGTEEITPANGAEPYTTMATMNLIYSERKDN